MEPAPLRRLLWAPVILLCILAGVLGWRLGRAPDETEAITRIAARYVAEMPGARATDCAARPGTGAVWLVVACGVPGSETRRVYRLDPRGRVIERPGA